MNTEPLNSEPGFDTSVMVRYLTTNGCALC